MPQLSLYIDRVTLDKIDTIAKRNHVSVSKWVGNSIRKFLKEEFPEDYFSLFGSIHDATFNKPESLSFTDDTARESL